MVLYVLVIPLAEPPPFPHVLPRTEKDLQRKQKCSPRTLLILRLWLGLNSSLIGIRHRSSAQSRTHFNSIRARLTNKSRNKPLAPLCSARTKPELNLRLFRMSNQTEKKRERKGKRKRRRENKQANNNKRKQKEKQGSRRQRKRRQQKRFSVAAGSSQRADYMTASSAMHTS